MKKATICVMQVAASFFIYWQKIIKAYIGSNLNIGFFIISG